MSVYAAIAARVRTTAARIDDVLTPADCAVCGRWIRGENPALCGECRAALEATMQTAYCPGCGRSAHSFSLHNGRCTYCRKPPLPHIAGVARVGAYDPALRRLVLGLKYHGRERAARILGRLLAEELRRTPWIGQVDALVTVPMHWLRRVQRPCHHTRVLAQYLTKQLNMPAIEPVRRCRHTISQVSIQSRKTRVDNVRGCFTLRRRACVHGLTLCVVDNLLATGATVCEVARVLRQAGAKRVYAAVVSRTVLGGEPQPTVLPMAAAPREPRP